jgi:hypothetical protein
MVELLFRIFRRNMDLELRKKVAKIVGLDPAWVVDPSMYELKNAYGNKSIEIPKYELSVDVIIKEFRVKGWDFVLEPITPITYRATSKYWGVEVEDKCAAKALCLLFIQLHEFIDK